MKFIPWFSNNSQLVPCGIVPSSVAIIPVVVICYLQDRSDFHWNELNMISIKDFLFAIKLSFDLFYKVHISTKYKKIILKLFVHTWLSIIKRIIRFLKSGMCGRSNIRDDISSRSFFFLIIFESTIHAICLSPGIFRFPQDALEERTTEYFIFFLFLSINF
jgi:hypothetical protein